LQRFSASFTSARRFIETPVFRNRTASRIPCNFPTRFFPASKTP